MRTTSHKVQQNTLPAIDRGSAAVVKPKPLKLAGWDYIGLFRPHFEHGLQQKNSVYELGYN